MSNSELLKVPEPFIVITGEDQIIGERIDLFFTDVLKLFSFKESVIGAFVERKVQTLGIEDPSGFRPSDDRITLLIIRNLAVASVLERRDDFNYIEVSFAHYLTLKRMGYLKSGLI